MSPLKLALLLRAYALPTPNYDTPAAQAFAPAMVEAINEMRTRGIFRSVASAATFRIGYPNATTMLTPKGKALAQRILAAAEECYKEASE